MKTMIRLLTLVLCIALLTCGCGSKKDDRSDDASDETKGNGLTDLFNKPTTEPTTEPTEETEPEPVYEKQTVYLCTVEKQTLHENDATSVRCNSYDEYGRKIESWIQKPDGSKGSVSTFTYDEFGNNIMETTQYGYYERTFDEEGRILSQLYFSGDECVSEYYYTYNEDGYLIERTETTRYSEEKTYIYKISYYPDYSNAVIDAYLNGEKIGFSEESYNADGQVIFYKNYEANGKLISTCESTYDSEGRLLEEYKKSSRDTQPNYKVIYTYDENGLLKSMDADYYYGHIVEYTYEPFEILVRVN
jgi:hypothetical protein